VIWSAPVLAFPLVYPWITLAVLGLGTAVWLVAAARGLTSTGFGSAASYAAGLRWTLTVFSACVLMGTLVSRYPHLTIPKLSGIALGLLTMRAVLMTATTLPRVWFLTRAYLIAGLLMTAAGVLASPVWQRNKSVVLNTVALKIPRILTGLPGAEAGVNPNGLAGSTLWFLPLFLAVAIAGRALWTGPLSTSRPPGACERAAALVASGLLLTVIVLCQSRTAWLSVVLTGLVMLAARFRPIARLGVAATVVIVCVGFLYGSKAIQVFPSATSIKLSGPVAPASRVEIWSLALRSIREDPLAGVGLGAFRETVLTMDGVEEPKNLADIGHAHNIFLQVALDVGIPGLVAYLVLLTLCTRLAWEIRSRSRDPGVHSLALGLWAGLFAIHIFGLSDAIALGSKAGVFFWWNLALVVSLHRVTVSAH